jgi:hypothetical protein
MAIWTCALPLAQLRRRLDLLLDETDFGEVGKVVAVDGTGQMLSTSRCRSAV